jgi:hypothetical protein
MRQRRIVRFAFGSLLMTTAACSAIAGLDGDFDLGGASPNNQPDGSSSGSSSGTDGSSSSGTDGNVTDGGPGTSDTGPGPGDGGTPDADAEPKDACTTRTVIEATTSSVPEKNGTCSEAPLCFNFYGNQQPAPFGWGYYDASAGNPVLVGSFNDATRRLRGQILPEAGPGTSSAVFIEDWNSAAGPFVDPLQVDAGSALKLTFLFLVTKVDRQADVMALTVNGKTYGLTLYPDPCGGDARVAQSGLNAADPEIGGATVQPGKWYLAEVHFNRAKDNSWSGGVAVGGVDGGSTNGIYISGLPRDVNATIGAGVISSGPGVNLTSTTIVDVDDIAMVYIPYNQ